MRRDMKDIHEKLAVWSRLSRECEQLRSRLLRDQQLDANPLAAEFAVLQARTDAAFKDVSEAIKRAERARPAADSSRHGQALAMG
jgi:hypothetical protein